MTFNETRNSQWPYIFQVTIEAMDVKAHEEIELTVSKFVDFTTMRIPDMNKLRLVYVHIRPIIRDFI